MIEAGDEGASAPLSKSDQVKAVGELLNGASAPGDDKAAEDDAASEQERSTALDADAQSADAADGRETSESSEQQSSGDGDGAEAPQITSLKDLATAAGIDMSQLYDLTIGFADGAEPMKLGAVKDAMQAGLDVEKHESNLADERNTFENDVMRTRQELQHVASQMQMTPEQQQRAREQLDVIKAREQTALYQAVPKLADDADFRKATHNSVSDLASSYGVQQHEVDNMTDHRIYKLVMDFAALKQRVADANRTANKLRKGSGQGSGNASNGGRSSGKADALATTAKRTGLLKDQVSAVAALLGAGQ